MESVYEHFFFLNITVAGPLRKPIIYLLGLGSGLSSIGKTPEKRELP